MSNIDILGTQLLLGETGYERIGGISSAIPSTQCLRRRYDLIATKGTLNIHNLVYVSIVNHALLVDEDTTYLGRTVSPFAVHSRFLIHATKIIPPNCTVSPWVQF